MNLRCVFAFGTVPVNALASAGLTRYARQRAMKAFRSLFGQKPSTPPSVIRLPNGGADRDGLHRRARALRKRAMVLIAAIAVPAMAAASDFGALPGDAPTEAQMVNARLAAQLAQNPPMPFERPGMSFPGSAFFFLADPAPSDALVALPTTDAFDYGAAEAGHELGELIEAGPTARPFFGAGGLSQLRAQDCLAQAIWYEAASESEAGQRAVAQVVLNRVANPAWPNSVCGVVYQGSQRATGCQFTFTCDGSLSRRAGGASWLRAQAIAAEALSGSVYAPVGLATHYHTLWVNPYWAPTLDHVGTIGAHRFYRTRGASGQPGAFSTRYAGIEPSVSGRTTPPPAGFDPAPGIPEFTGPTARVAVQPATAPSAAGARASTGSVPEPILADPAYAGVGQVREDYARAGQWKSDAARAALQADERARAAH
jgi:hypothetical protein